MQHPNPVIVVHGGAGDWPSALHKQGWSGVRAAADRGFRILSRGGSAVDAVEAAIVAMEDNPVFNAGKGSTLNLLGEIETDAAIMDGKTLRGAGVALLRDIKNPIRAARIVMNKTGHVLIAGVAAREIAVLRGLATSDLRVAKRLKAWKEGLRKLKGERYPYLLGMVRRSSNIFPPNIPTRWVLLRLMRIETWPRLAPKAESPTNFREGLATALFSARASMPTTIPEQRRQRASVSKR